MVTARPRHKIPTPEIGNTWFATTFPSCYYFFCNITECIHGTGLMGYFVHRPLIYARIAESVKWLYIDYTTELPFLEMAIIIPFAGHFHTG
jgi:hypothetical protein